MQKKCTACGMPMEKTEDYPLKDETKNYCTHCANPDGTMHSYDEQVKSMSKFIMQTKGLDEANAQEKAKELMSTLPAWKNKCCK
jgi:ribosomal protein L37E